MTTTDVRADPLPGMPQRLFTCTPSRLLTWFDCPRRYRMTYLDRPRPAKGPPWAHLSLGAAVHAAIAAWWHLPRPQRTVGSAGQLLDRAWSADGFRDDEQAERWRLRAREMVAAHVSALDPADEPVGVERTVAFRTQTLAVSGRLDRLDRRGEELVVVDYKSGRRVPTTDETRGSLALALYALAAERVLHRRCRRVELHHLPSGEVVAHEHSDDALQRHLRRAEDLAADAVAGVAAGEFPARPGRQCAWCDFAAHCPEGRAAGPPADPWSGLADEFAEPEVLPE
jgi:hypothetical protein